MVSIFGQSLSFVLFAAGVALTILEAFAPGAHFIVIGVALLTAGLIGLLFPPAATPLVLGAIILVTGAGSYYLYRRFDFYTGTERGQTKSSRDLAGARGYVTERVTPRSGRVKLESGGFDPTYAARSIDGEIAEGTEIFVVDPGGGNLVTVEAVEQVDNIDRELQRGRASVETDEDDEMKSSAEADVQSAEEAETEADEESTGTRG